MQASNARQLIAFSIFIPFEGDKLDARFPKD
jgi:hypothetical protein